MGETILQRMEIDESFFGKKHGKLAHGQKISPKIFLVHKSVRSINFILDSKLKPWLQGENKSNICTKG